MAKEKWIIQVPDARTFRRLVKIEAVALIGNTQPVYSLDKSIAWVSTEPGSSIGRLVRSKGPFTPEEAAAERLANSAVWEEPDPIGQSR